MKETYITITEKGIVNKEAFKAFLRGLGFGRFILKAEKKDKRSLPQNAYLHACVIPIVLECLKDAGWNQIKTLEDAKDFIKVKFLSYDMVNEETGEVITMFKNTSGLNKEEFAVLIQEISIWLAEYFQTILPEPGQQSTFNL
jgi:RNA-binding protein YhbY